MVGRQRTVSDVFDNLSEQQKIVAYEIVGQALEHGDYDREALVIFNTEEQTVIKLLIDQAMKGD